MTDQPTPHTPDEPAVPTEARYAADASADRVAALQKAKVHVQGMLLAGASIAEADTAIERVDLNDRSPQSVVDEVHGELYRHHAHETLPASELTRGVIGAAIGAIAAAAAWAAIVKTTGYQIGFAAIGIGYLVGWCALKATGQRKSNGLVMAVAALTIVAYLAGKYFTIWAQLHDVQSSLSPFDPELLRTVISHPRDFFELFDLLWIGLALSVGVRMVRPALGKLAPPRHGTSGSGAFR